ncbi:hypothetical protein ACLMJK_006960 [Lecanora helva]
MNPTTIPSPTLSIINYESQDAKEDSEYQVHFTNSFAEGSHRNSSTYQKAVVLLLSWEKNSDSLATEEEVKRLKVVFEDKLHYQTESAFLSKNTGRSLQLQLNRIVATFAEKHSGPHTLLIVYYAGHGRPGSYYGELELIDGYDAGPSISEPLLNRTGDHLGLAKRYFEYLAACGPVDSTRVPGPKSFTSALILALEFLADPINKPGGRFTTVDLLNRIKEHSPEFPADQNPKLCDRRKANGKPGYLMLHPLHLGAPQEQIIPKESDPGELTKIQTVTLHFDFSDRPPLEHIGILAQELDRISDQHSLQFHDVRWGGIKRSMAARAIQWLLQGRERRANLKRKRENASPTEEKWPCQTTSGPLTPSSRSRTPQLEGIVAQDRVIHDPSHLSAVPLARNDTSSNSLTQRRSKRRKTTTTPSNTNA